MNPAQFQVSRGAASPLGASFDGNGINFAVFSAHAEKIELCLFDGDGRREVCRLVLPERDGDIWHGFVDGLRPGTIYGYRVHGPYAPEDGHRFNPNKLLLDPYTRKIDGAVEWSDALLGFKASSSRRDLSFDTRDSAPYMPKSVVVDTAFDWNGDRSPRVDPADAIIYETHVKGQTAERSDIDPAMRGRFLGLSSAPMLDHLTGLGITTVELLPVQAFVDDRFLVDQGLRNYWGYNSIGFFSPEPRYLSHGAVSDFQRMVQQFHAAGIEVIVDVVYNHTAEGDETGPTLSFRGLDNRSYYRLRADDQRYYENFSGTGNSLNIDHPMVLRMVLDSMRYWVEIMHVDGFRFDLASVLGRTGQGFDRTGPFFKAVLQDPVLSRVKLIAEPWDIGPGGYQLGAYPAPFLEWNDQYRDDVRRFWRGDENMTAKLAERLVGSALQFDHSGRSAFSSVNFVAAHDGFTLSDVVSYSHKQNEANGEGNQDGHNENHTDNMGVEGATIDPDINLARAQRKRNLLTTLLISQGTPMLLAGDEIGNSQHGNNNAYCQDNPIGWINWTDPDTDLLAFVQKLIGLRKAHPVLRQRHFLHSHRRPEDGMADLFWRMPDGREPSSDEWREPHWRCLCVEIRMATTTPAYDASEDEIFAVLNGGERSEVVLPPCRDDRKWVQVIDTARPTLSTVDVVDDRVMVSAASVTLFALEAISSHDAD
ncbi:MAG: glycogen debranching protein GlgX [Alphaproteobacteria bacterium]|nr:glycogen debranching protein GlgX [Alphaproteobacteria bacterium]